MKVYHTEKREAVADFLCSHASESFSLEELCKILCPDGKGKSTVYRLISRFVDEGTVRKIADIRTRHNSYQWIGEGCSHHLHLKCTECGKLLHMGHTLSEQLLSDILGESDFSVRVDSTTLFGCCKDCRIKEG